MALAELGVSAEEAGIEVLSCPAQAVQEHPGQGAPYVEDEKFPEAPAPKEEKPLPKAAPKAAESPDAPQGRGPCSAAGASTARCRAC